VKSLSNKMIHAFIGSILIICVCSVLTIFASASEIPNSIVTENRDGRQLIVKTYTLAPDADPSGLYEDSFELEGFAYTQISITKAEKPFLDTKLHSETITINPEKDNLEAVLKALAPTLNYNSGGYTGTLALDHTSIVTEATGYNTRSYTVTDTKVIDNLDRNDPSYIPQTTVKNGQTLTLSNIEWSVQGSSLADDSLVPTLFMATATYSGNGSSRVAEGYVTTATYSGEIVSSGTSEIEYTVTFLGKELSDIETIPLPEEVSDTAEAVKGSEGKMPIINKTSLTIMIPLLVAALGIGTLYVRERNKSANLRKELYFGMMTDLNDEAEVAE